MKNFNIMGCSLRNPISREGGSPKKTICKGGNCLKRGLGQFPDLRGDLKIKKGWCI